MSENDYWHGKYVVMSDIMDYWQACCLTAWDELMYTQEQMLGEQAERDYDIWKWADTQATAWIEWEKAGNVIDPPRGVIDPPKRPF